MPSVMDLANVEVGTTAELRKAITQDDVLAFARLSGDYNPLHVDPEFARTTSFQRPVAHGMLLASFVSTMIGMQLPGPGALWMRQSFEWSSPVFAGDTVDITLTVIHKSSGSNTITLKVLAVNQHGRTVMSGEGAVMLLEQHERKRERPMNERVAFVTGGSRGIGASIARLLGQAGAAVAVNYRESDQAAAGLVDAIRQQGGRAFAVHADVTVEQDVRTALAATADEFGQPVDVLVNNASIPFHPRPFLEADWDEMQRLIDVQIRGAFHCCQAVLPAMVERKSGCIVNVGSVLTHNIPPAQWTGFVTAKSALLGLTRALASEFGPLGIRVNMVSPGTTETESSHAIPERLRKVQAMQTPLRRLAAADDVAKTVLFLCSDASDFLTGVDLPVCGGISA